jgi:hypothetical protein
MARIEGPKQGGLTQVSSKALEPIATPQAAAIAAPSQSAPDYGASGLDPRKQKGPNTTGASPKYVPGAFNDQATPELQAFLKSQMGASAKSGPGPLQFKGGETASATKAFTPAGFAKAQKGNNLSDTGTAIASLSEKDKKALGAAIKSGAVSDPTVVAAFVNTHDPAGMGKVLRGLPTKTLEGLKEMTRTADMSKHALLACGLGIELLSKTKWAKANGPVIEKLRAGFDKGNVMGGRNNGLGATSNGQVQINDKLLNSPEALQSILAHEGTHLHQGTTCCGGGGASSPNGEIAGVTEQTKVWDELGKKTDAKLDPLALAQLNAYSTAAKGGPGELKTRVLTMYLTNASTELVSAKNDFDNSYKDKYAKRKDGNKVGDWEAQVKVFTEALASHNADLKAAAAAPKAKK